MRVGFSMSTISETDELDTEKNGELIPLNRIFT